MEKVVKTVICDMCGAEIDTDDDKTLLNSVISGGYYGVVVHEHDPSHAEGFRTSIQHESIDLCPACADRAAEIHVEVVPDGRTYHNELSWRSGEGYTAPYVGLKVGNVHESHVLSEYYCGRCGYPVTDHDSYCSECGGALREDVTKEDE